MITPAFTIPVLVATIALATTFDVTVAPSGNLTFSPDQVAAVPGDRVIFHFNPKNHTLTQSSLEDPCTRLQGGTDSGFMPVEAGDTSKTFEVTVQNTTPVFFYCRQKNPINHCHKGMVFALNAQPGDFSKFKAAALALDVATTSSGTPTTSTSWVSPPAPSVATLTATVVEPSSTYTTTYASWLGASPNPTPAVKPTTHTVTVGGTAGLVFTPPKIIASVGDTVQFTFQVKNHTVTQSTFSNPCSPKVSGFDSGFMPVASTATTFPTYNVTVTDVTPIWIYCRQANHCQSGMVAAVNPPETGPNTFEAFQQLAEHSNATGGGGGNATGTSPTPSATKTSAAGGLVAAAGAGWSVALLGIVAVLFL